MDTFLSYLSYFVAWQGMFAFLGVVVLLIDHFGRKSDDERPDLDIEKFKLWFLPVWFALTLLGFYNDAASVPAFAQAHSLRNGELSFLLAYASIFGSLVCLLYAPYKFVVAVSYVAKNRGRRAKISMSEDEFFGSLMEAETSVYTSLSADVEISDGREVTVEITFPPLDEILKESRDRIREHILSRSRDFVRSVISRETEYRAQVAKRFAETRRLVEAGSEYDPGEIAVNMMLQLIECDFRIESGEKIGVESFTLDYSNSNPFGEEEVSINVTEGGKLILEESYGMLTVDEEIALDDAASDALFLPESDEASVGLDPPEKLADAKDLDEDPENLKPSYL